MPVKEHRLEQEPKGQMAATQVKRELGQVSEGAAGASEWSYMYDEQSDMISSHL